MQSHSFTRTARFTPAAVGTNETTTVMRIAKGWRLKRASVKILTATDALSTNTVSLGDSSGVTAVSATIATKSDGANPVGTLVQADGNITNGKLYNAANTLKVDYVKGATPGATAPSIMVQAEFIAEWPS